MTIFRFRVFLYLMNDENKKKEVPRKPLGPMSPEERARREKKADWAVKEVCKALKAAADGWKRGESPVPRW